MTCTPLVIGRAACLELLLGASLFVLFFASAAADAASAPFALCPASFCCLLLPPSEEAEIDAELIVPVPARAVKTALLLRTASVALDEDEPPDAGAGAATPLEAGWTVGRREVELMVAAVRHAERAFASRAAVGGRLALGAAAAAAAAALPLPTAAELERVRRGVAPTGVDGGAPERMLLARAPSLPVARECGLLAVGCLTGSRADCLSG
jgi:hypothetical protein